MKLGHLERQALLQDQRAYVPAYLGPSGWVGMDLEPGERCTDDAGDGDGIDWAEIAELVETSYRLTAGPRLVSALDSQRTENPHNP